MSSHHQASVILTLSGLAMGIWGVISLIAASIREREMLIDNHARLDVLDRVMVREPLRMLKEVARPKRVETVRSMELSPELQAQLNAIAQIEGRDRAEILAETLEQRLARYKQRRAA